MGFNSGLKVLKKLYVCVSFKMTQKRILIYIDCKMYLKDEIMMTAFFSCNTPIRCTNISNLFWNETLYVSDGSSVHQLTACEQDQNGTAAPS
jgi:hypothetical protein